MAVQKIAHLTTPGRTVAIGFFVFVLTISLAYFFGTTNTQVTISPPETSSSTASSVSMIRATSTHTLVAFGDSITAGYGIDVSDAYPRVLEQLLLNEGLRVKVINAGVSGETTAGGLRRVDFVVNQKPDIVLVALGGNDVLRGIPPSNTKENLARIIEKFQAGGVRVILAGMFAPENLGEVYVREFNALYPALSEKYNVPLIPFLLAGVALEPSLNQQDGIHPNEVGARVIARDNILPVLVQLLREEF